MKKKLLKTLSLAVFLINSLSAISLVYNLKIRRAFDLPRSLIERSKSLHHLWIASAVPIVYQRTRNLVIPELKTDILDMRTTEGSLLNLRYKPSRNWWFEASTGLEKEYIQTAGTTILTASRGGFDDFVFSGGYIAFPKDHVQMVAYGLFGVPSRWRITANERILDDTLVGTRFFAVGGGLESSYGFIEDIQTSLIGVIQARFIHFFTRSVDTGTTFCNYIQPGNLIDFLFLAQYRKEATLFEVGYNPTFFTNQALIANDVKTESSNFVRQGFTISCTHLFKNMLFSHMPLIIGVGINKAHSKMFDTKIVSAWLNFTTIF